MADQQGDHAETRLPINSCLVAHPVLFSDRHPIGKVAAMSEDALYLHLCRAVWLNRPKLLKRVVRAAKKHGFTGSQVQSVMSQVTENLQSGQDYRIVEKVHTFLRKTDGRMFKMEEVVGTFTEDAFDHLTDAALSLAISKELRRLDYINTPINYRENGVTRGFRRWRKRGDSHSRLRQARSLINA